ncbi:putative RNA-directed DNA polymerase from transposon BS [Trichonephila clavipes]|nr:putative RNA-directed DNA polymerase from transposon BS [Trichonephila clavipes]
MRIKPPSNLKKNPEKNTSLKIAREQDSPNETSPVSKKSRRRKTFKASDAMDTDANPSDTDYVTDDVKDIIRQYHPVCVALQETFLKSCHTTKIRRYGCVRKDTEGPSVSGGVCIFTSLDVPSSVLPLHTSLQAVALPEPFIILGDFNGHSTLWGSAKTNPRGRQIEQVLSDHCLCLLNHEEPTYFHEPTRSFHTIDLDICSPSLLPHLNLSVEKNLYNSDPFPVILSHDSDPCGKTFPPTYSYRRADWALFTQLAVITDAMVKTENVGTAVQEVTNVLIAAADLSIPKVSSHSFQRYKPWWNADCQTAYKNQRKLWGIFRRYPTTENLLAFKKAKANARRVRRRSQRQSWIRYVSSLTSSTSSKQLWKKVKAATGYIGNFPSLFYKPRTLSFLPQKKLLTFWSGFRKGRSTLDNLVFLEPQIRDAFVRRHHLVSLFFDIEKAYDRAWRYGILQSRYFECTKRLDYGCVVYGSARASAAVAEWYRTSPVTSLYVVCHQPPLELRRRQLSANYFIRAMSVPSHPIKPFSLAIGLTRLYEARSFNIRPFSERAKAVLNDAHLNNINIQENNILAFPAWDIQIFNYHNPFSGYDKEGTAAVIYQQLFSFHRCKYSKYIPVYTDGSKTAGHVGHPTVIEILLLLRKLERKGFDIIFSWVPGHVGIIGNEQADTAARSMSEHMQRPVCYQDLKTSAQNYIHRVWQETWDQQVLNKLYSIHPSISHWAALPVRRHDVRLTRLRIGHTRFTHRHLLLAFLGGKLSFTGKVCFKLERNNIREATEDGINDTILMSLLPLATNFAKNMDIAKESERSL